VGRRLSANTFDVGVEMGRLNTIGIVAVAARIAKRNAQESRAKDEASKLGKPQ
jgi:hypothetical protein